MGWKPPLGSDLREGDKLVKAMILTERSVALGPSLMQGSHQRELRKEICARSVAGARAPKTGRPPAERSEPKTSSNVDETS